MMEFYTLLSRYYDDIFKTNEKAISFIRDFLPPGGRLLDLGAGTGAEAIEFAKARYSVTATDYSREMVDIINQKSAILPEKMDAAVLDMRDVSQLAPQVFHSIYCIGNTFVHLDSYEEMTDVLIDCFNRLLPNGVLIIQIVNYDKIIAKSISSLPVIQNREAGVTFERFYFFNDNKITFHGKLTIASKDGSVEKIAESSTDLLLLPSKKLMEIVEATPFSSLDLYGSFTSEKFTLDSPALIAVLKKGE